jgi:hypothetical protein
MSRGRRRHGKRSNEKRKLKYILSENHACIDVSVKRAEKEEEERRKMKNWKNRRNTFSKTT